MIIKPARMNQNGVNTLVRFAHTPQHMAMDLRNDGNQRYVPGISVPDVKDLRKPFNVPIVGDNESVSLSLDWPRKGDQEVWQRITFVGMLVAESVTVGAPKNRNLSLWEDDIAIEDQPVDDAYDEYTGEWGGFLRAAVEKVVVLQGSNKPCLTKRGSAEFVLMENEQDFETTHALLRSGQATAAEIVSAVRVPDLASRIGAPMVAAVS